MLTFLISLEGWKNLLQGNRFKNNEAPIKERMDYDIMRAAKEMKRIIGAFVIIAVAITALLGHPITVGANPVINEIEIPIDGEGPDLYELCELYELTSNYPIIIIPGVKGSNLYSSPDLFTRRNRVFAPDPSNNRLDITMIFGLGNNMRMRNTLHPRPMENMNAPGAHQEYGAMEWYRFLVEQLLEAFPEREIYFFAYDFRQDNRITATLLNEGIESILSSSDYDKVEIVAHSMGGLIVASYISQYTEASLGRVVIKGTPFEGAPETFMAVLEGELGGSTFQNMALALIGRMGVEVSSEFPSLPQLVPTLSYFEENPFYKFSHTTGIIIRRRQYAQMSYEQYFNMLDSLFQWGQRRNFLEAKEFHQSISSEGVNILANYQHAYFAIGINQRTISGVRFDPNSRIRNRLRVTDVFYENYGDGVVPYASQTMMRHLENIERADERIRRFDLHHLNLVGSNAGQGIGDAVAWAVDVLNGNAGDTEIHDALPQSRSYTVLRIEGAVEITVETPEGILTVTEDELSLLAPFGRMDIIGDEGEIIILALEDWEEHEITINVIEVGTLDYTIRWFDEDNNLVDERNFVDIPVSENETITSSTALEEVTVLEIDRSGDGIADERWEAEENSQGSLEEVIEPRERRFLFNLPFSILNRII